jgi:glycolate oxidase
MLSSVCNPGLEATAAAAADNYRIFQLYVRGDDAWVDDHVKRAKDNGYSAFCLTVDTATYSRRERDLLKRFVKPWRTRASGFDYQAGLSWDHVKRFKDTHDIPLILKGIATAEDATLACEHGVDVVYVSNHGGRQLDHGRGSMDVLPEVVDAVGGRASIMVDGGFMRGTDVAKAIAMGADCVGIGRLECLGLAAAGTPGLDARARDPGRRDRICASLGTRGAHSGPPRRSTRSSLHAAKETPGRSRFALVALLPPCSEGTDLRRPDGHRRAGRRRGGRTRDAR